MRRFCVAVAVAAAALAAWLVPGSAHPVRQGADAGFTYGYLPSVVAHGDLDFSDDSFPFDSTMPHTATGLTHNAFAIGPGVWWSPAFLAAHGVGAVARVVRSSPAPAPDGRSWPYDGLVGLEALALGVVGLWATAALARRFAGPFAAGLGTVAVWLAGPVVYYTHVNVMQGHAAAFAASALLLLAWVRAREQEDGSLWRVLALGLLGGLVALTRWQDGLLLLGPLLDALWGRLRGRAFPDWRAGVVLAGGAVAAFVPQMIVWNTLFGSPFRPPRGETSGAFLDPSRLHVPDVLLSWRHGMLSWHPILIVGIVGLALVARRRPLVGGALLVVLVVTVLVNAAILDWWAGVSFGARRFDGLWPALALGVAVVAERVPRWLSVAVVAVLASVNAALLVAFAAYRVSVDGPVHPTDLWRALPHLPLVNALDEWSPRKVVWVGGLVALAAVAAVAPRVRRVSWPAIGVAGLAGAAVVSATVGAAAAATDHPYDAHVFEAGYFVPQPTRPSRTDRIVRPGEDVWTLVWAFPGFLPPGRYTATATGVSGAGHLVVRLDGRTIAEGDAAASPATLAGAPFRTHTGFLRLDFRVTGAPVHITAVRIDPAPRPNRER